MPAPSIDGLVGGNASSVSSKTLSLTTTVVHDAIVAVIGYELGAAQRDVTGVASATLGAFTRRCKVSNAGQNHETIEIWWAPSAGILTAENITVTWDNAFDDAAVVIFGVKDCGNYLSPWDTNGGLPFSSTSGGPPSVNFSTTGAPTLVLGISGMVDNISPAAPSGWTNIHNQSNNGGAAAQSTCIDGKEFAAAASSQTYLPTHHDQGVVVVDALLGAVSAAAGGRITQGTRQLVAAGPGAVRATQATRMILGSIAPPGRVTQAHRLLIGFVNPPARVTQAFRLVIAQGVGCVTHWQQLWTLRRRDGVTFRFTSLDADFRQGAIVYKSCGGLFPSASEESSEIGTVSNMELSGILADDAITEADLYGGLFDDAFVEVWLAPYQGTETPRRLAAGWLGTVQHGENGWTGEVTGPGARLDQQALVVPYSPACRWTFGDSRCQVDLTALQLDGTVTEGVNRGLIVAGVSSSSAEVQWPNGRVIWQTGRNTGVTCEIKEVDFGVSDAEISLWALAPFLPEPGDEFIMQPGCDLSAATCKNVYSNLINFGGFKDVPGNDAITATPLAKVDT
jgi:uncharacterized phage protein (TIGR02218 family)